MKNKFLFFQDRDFSFEEEYKKSRRKIFLFQSISFALIFFYSFQNGRVNNSFDIELFFLALGLVASSFLTNTFFRKFIHGDPYLLMIAQALFSIGVIVVYRIDPDAGIKQLKFYFLSLLAFFFVYFLLKKTYAFWENRSFLFYYVLSALLLLMTLAFGFAYGGAKNWIEIGSYSVQPSEFAKIPFIFFVAAWYKKYESFQQKKWMKYSLMFLSYFLILLFFLQRELGTAIVFYSVLTASQVAYEQNKRLIIYNILLAFLGLLMAYFLFSHIRVRFAIWRNPWEDPMNTGYQIIQSLIAIAEGGFFGKGLGLGSPNLIPLGHSDFIFASIIEEMGLFMGICLIFLYILLIYRGSKVAISQERDFYSVLALCISFLFASQAFIMFAGVMKVIPLTGITIPFLTYGGSSLLSSFILLACLQVSTEDFMLLESNHEKI